MLLELGLHEASCFITLTYTVAPVELNPDDLQAFLKRLRSYRGPFRFYAVGEYGSRNCRPHYHAALFGVSMSEAALIAKAWRGHVVPCKARDVPLDSFGGVHVGELNKDSAQYLVKYVCKSVLDRQKFAGLHPEFARMSLRPGIGGVAIASIVENLVRAHGGSIEPEDIGDVPSVVRIGKKAYPIGSHLRRKLRSALGWDEGSPVAVRERLAAENLEREKARPGYRERRRQVSYDQLESRLKIQKSKEIL